MAGVETGWFRGEGGTVWRMDLPLPPVFASQIANGAIQRVSEDGSPWEQPQDDEDSTPVAPAERPAVARQLPPPFVPKPADHKQAWVDYAVNAHQADRAEAERMTKPQLGENYGQPS